MYSMYCLEKYHHVQKNMLLQFAIYFLMCSGADRRDHSAEYHGVGGARPGLHLPRLAQAGHWPGCGLSHYQARVIMFSCKQDEVF